MTGNAGKTFMLIVLVILGATLLLRNSNLDLNSKLKFKSSHDVGLRSVSRNEAMRLASLDAVILIDTQGRIIEFSSAAERMLGYLHSEVRGRHLNDFLRLPETLKGRRYDVMGKGVNAALMGAAVKMPLRRSLIELTTSAIVSGRLPQPAEVVRSMHREVSPHFQALEAFVTLCYLRIDMRTNTVTWVGCGHEEAYWGRV